MRSWHFIVVIGAITLASCGSKKLDLNSFSMEIPSGWEYEPGNGTDTFVGTINTSASPITFEYSAKGFANSLIPTEKQYLADQTLWATSTCYFCQSNITYAPKEEIERQKQALMKQAGVTDTALVHVEPNIEYSKSIRKTEGKWHKYYPGSDYIAELKYRDSTIFVPIYIPKSIQNHVIRIDTTTDYIIKTIYPITPEDGTTGVYIKSRTTAASFNMRGTNLPEGEQKKALAAFKTIKLKL